jgi:hypothetical protein
MQASTAQEAGPGAAGSVAETGAMIGQLNHQIEETAAAINAESAVAGGDDQ